MKRLLMVLWCLLLCTALISCSDNGFPPLDTDIINHENENAKIEAYAPNPMNGGGQRFDYAKNQDNKYHFYYFYLGTVGKVPVYSSHAIKYQFDKNKVTMTFNSLTEETLSNTVSKSEEIIDTGSYTGGFSVGVAAAFEGFKGALASIEVAATTDHHWTKNWGSTVTESNSKTSAYVEEYGKTFQVEVEFSEDAGYKKGKYYRLTFFETVKAYGVLIYDAEKNEYYSTTQSFLQPDSTSIEWEESSNGSFNYEKNGELNFDVEKAIAYAKEHPLERVETGNGTDTVYVDTTSLSCKHDKGYNHTQPDPNKNNAHYSHNFMMGRFVLEGGSYDDGKLIVKPGCAASVGFRLEYDPDSLPLQDNMTDRYVSNDSYDSKLYDLSFVGSRKVGKGLLVATFTYHDGTPSDTVCIENVFANKNQGDVIEIKSDVAKSCDVEIAILYELEMWAPGFLGISGRYWMDWRINQEFEILR